MKAIIEDPNHAFFPRQLTEENLSTTALVKLRAEVSRRLYGFLYHGKKRPDWEQFDRVFTAIKYTHLVYYVELDGVAHIYANGYLMEDDEFDRDVACRDGVSFVGAFHRME